MTRVRPLNERRDHTGAGQMAVVGNRDSPVVRTPRHVVYSTRIDSAGAPHGIEIIAACDPMNESRPSGQRVTHGSAVEVEPSLVGRRNAVRVDGDQLDEPAFP